MTGLIVVCEATDCTHNIDRNCHTTDVWITDNRRCENYEPEEANPDSPIYTTEEE